MSESTKKQESLGQKVLGIFAWIFGGAVGIYAGINLLIPLFFTICASWLAKRLLPEQKKLVIHAFAVQCGHGLWMSFGLLLIGTLDKNALDILLLVGGLTWLIAKPSRGPLYLLGAYQLLAVIYNGYLFYGAEVGSLPHKALLVHIIWRSLALFFIGQVFLKLRQAKMGTLVVP